MLFDVGLECFIRETKSEAAIRLHVEKISGQLVDRPPLLLLLQDEHAGRQQRKRRAAAHGAKRFGKEVAGQGHRCWRSALLHFLSSFVFLFFVFVFCFCFFCFLTNLLPPPQTLLRAQKGWDVIAPVVRCNFMCCFIFQTKNMSYQGVNEWMNIVLKRNEFLGLFCLLLVSSWWGPVVREFHQQGWQKPVVLCVYVVVVVVLCLSIEGTTSAILLFFFLPPTTHLWCVWERKRERKRKRADLIWGNKQANK